MTAASDRYHDRAEYAPRDWASQPANAHASYRSTATRAPREPLIPLAQTLTELTGPVYGHEAVGVLDADLTRNAVRNGEPLGERIIVAGRVLDEQERPVPHTLTEIWQTNAAGRYVHRADRHDAPLDPNFHGAGRCVTDAAGRYAFTTVRPGAYPWGNHHNGWRPAHIHFSLFGPSLVTRLVTQMYFPGDPLLPLDPIYMGVADERARRRLVAELDLELTRPEWALGFRFDIVLRGSRATPMEGGS